jgi:hypothetical protein
MGFMEVHCLMMKVIALVVAILAMMLIVAPKIMLPFTKYPIRPRVFHAKYLYLFE